MGSKASINIRTGNTGRVRMRVRKAVAEAIKLHVRTRVGVHGLGSDGPLQGYSTNPLVVDKSVKPKRQPARGWHSFHRGGYKQYRDELGLESEKFVFDNKGAAWRDWMQTTQDSAGPMQFGFANALNTMAAEAAIEHNRPDMFDLNEIELEGFAGEYLERFLDETWGK